MAALIVVLYHIKAYLYQYESASMFSWIYNKGYLAVDFFFILSGFIIAYNYKKTFEQKLHGNNYLIFVIKRFARIYPLHLFILLCYLLVPAAYYMSGRPLNNELYTVDAFIAKFLLVDLWFVGMNFWESWNVPSWTISGEMFAYLTFPFLCAFIQQRKIAVAFLFLFSVSVIAISYESLGSRSLGDGISELGLLRCLCEFICGVCVYVFHHNFKPLTESTNKWLAIVVGLLLVLLLLTIEKNHLYIPVLFSTLLYSLIGFRSGLHKILEIKPLVKLGDISYSIYLSHTFILTVYSMIFVKSMTDFNIIDAFAYISITIVFSAFTYRFIEMPMRKRICKSLLPRLKERV